MPGKFFLDTNIFAYTFDRDDPDKADRSSALVREAVSTRSGVVSYQVVQEFLNVALKKFDPPLTSMAAEQYLTIVMRPILAVQSSLALFARALRLKDQHRFSWYDSLIVAGALESGCRTLYTEDLQHGMRIDALTITDPFRKKSRSLH